MKIICIGRNYAEHAKELGNEAPSEPIIRVPAGPLKVGRRFIAGSDIDKFFRPSGTVEVFAIPGCHHQASRWDAKEF